MKTAPRAYRNQRLGRAPQQRRQQHLLEVSIRRDKERSRRIKQSLLLFAKVTLFSALAAGAWVGTNKALQRFFWQNQFFYLTDVRVTSDGTLTREQILSTANVLEGANIFTVNLGKARAALAQLPQVDHVEVQRTLPHRIDIDVAERQPIAWVTEQADIDPTATDRALLIDVHGVIIKSRKILPEYAHLPIISGAVLENLAPGQRVKEIEMLSALDLLKISGDGTRWQVRSIDVSKGYCLVAKGRDHAPIIFGLDNVDRQYARLNQILDYATSTHQEVQTANLLVERNTPVVLFDPDAEPPPAPPVPPGKGAVPGAKPLATPKPEAAKSGTGSDSRGKSPAPSSKPGNSRPPAGVKKPFLSHG